MNTRSRKVYGQDVYQTLSKLQEDLQKDRYHGELAPRVVLTARAYIAQILAETTYGKGAIHGKPITGYQFPPVEGWIIDDYVGKGLSEQELLGVVIHHIFRTPHQPPPSPRES